MIMENLCLFFLYGDLREARSMFVQKLQVIKEEYGDRDEDPFSYSIDDILLQCTFQGTDCHNSPLNFVIQQDELYGTCFEVEAPNVPVITAGPEQGLELLIYLNHEEFIPFIAEAIGINTRIYGSGNKNSFLAESSDGVKLSAGFDIRIAVSLTEYNRKPGNNEKCDNSNLFPNILSCLEQCLSDLVASKCRCENNNGECQGSTDLKCRKLFHQSIHSHCPACKQPCNEKKFEQFITMTRWPSRSTEPLIRKILTGKNKTITSLRDNVMLVRVYFSSLTVQSFNEEEAYTVHVKYIHCTEKIEENFVSDIGGQLGLWIGMSVLSLSEIFELVTLILIGLCGKRKMDITPVLPIKLNTSDTTSGDEDMSSTK